ncbi:fructosamine kinase family protein [Niveibacterium sp. 24ML]|uniref:fructosamine kinase family protein n=1 Tax=Niveibacterium sp. 24ML TaxID=2985512 RepID=UPI00226FE3EF|nr:fructosamine kinase family protein [Niveibacterium sp. 24ML]MCX9154594.1 fructosamine kinase family protein [Niveibacterium sp. 24ML]
MTPALRRALEDAIRHACGTRCVIEQFSAGPASAFGKTWLANGNGARWFVKTTAATGQSRLHCEAKGLGAIAATGTIRTPSVIALGAAEDSAFLVLEYLPMHTPTRDDGPRCAEALAALHACHGDRYGWPEDNYIGTTPQVNAWSDDWPRFFAEQRLAPHLRAAAEKGYRGELQSCGERVLSKIGAFFLERRPQASLIHGDLWAGNLGVMDTGEPVVFDPAAYYGDREADFAMSELFGGLPESFYATYRKRAPLADGYAQRCTLYNLYHMLNHLNLFGAGYLRQAERMARELSNYLRQ